jgi:hypothetical protein
MLRGAAALELKGQLPCKQAAQGGQGEPGCQGRLRSQEHLPLEPEPETDSGKKLGRR